MLRPRVSGLRVGGAEVKVFVRIGYSAVFVAACQGGETGLDSDSDSSDPDVAACFEATPAPDRVRTVVVSHPFADNGDQAPVYEVLRLSADGELSAPGVRFDMGRAFSGVIRFTPDGRLGAAVQEDGTLGLFRVADDGAVTVLDAAWGDDLLYASDVRFDADGQRMWVVDENWRENGGGLYVAELDCETGVPGAPELVAASKRARALFLLGDDRALLVATDVLDSAAGNEAHLLDLSVPAVLDGVGLFPDEDAIYAGTALTPDGWLLVGDYSQFSGVPNRVAWARWARDALTPGGVITPLEDPVSIAASPFGGAALVSSGFGDGVFALEQAGEGWTNAGEVSEPELPGAIATIDVGSQRGLALVAENLGVRVLRFEQDGGVEDRGRFTGGSGFTDIVGTLGVQP